MGLCQNRHSLFFAFVDLFVTTIILSLVKKCAMMLQKHLWPFERFILV